MYYTKMDYKIFISKLMKFLEMKFNWQIASLLEIITTNDARNQYF